MNFSSIDPKEYSEADIAHANTSLITEGLSTPDNYYFDLRFCKDMRLGALLYVIRKTPETAEENYKRILALMGTYQTRDYDDWSVFESLPFINEAKEAYDNQATVDEVFFHAPATKVMDIIDAHVVLNANHSQLRDKFRKVPLSKGRYTKDWDDITFVVNVYPHAVDSRVSHVIAAFFVDRYGVSVKPVSHAPFEIPASVFLQCDEFYLYRLDEFIASPEVQENLIPLKHLSKIIFTSQLFDPAKKAEFPHEKLKHEKRAFKSYTDLMVTLEWVPVRRYATMPELIPETF